MPIVGVDWRAHARRLEDMMQTDPETTKSSNPKDVLAASEQRVLLHLIPSPALAHTAQALMDGARKYGPYNWRQEGVSAVTYISATMRHLRDYLDGEDEAADSQVHHLGHAMACLAIILDGIELGNLVDDRPLPAPTSAIHERMKVKTHTVEFPGYRDALQKTMEPEAVEVEETLPEYVGRMGHELDQERETDELRRRIRLSLSLAPENKLFQELARRLAEEDEAEGLTRPPEIARRPMGRTSEDS